MERKKKRKRKIKRSKTKKTRRLMVPDEYVGGRCTDEMGKFKLKRFHTDAICRL